MEEDETSSEEAANGSEVEVTAASRLSPRPSSQKSSDLYSSLAHACVCCGHMSTKSTSVCVCVCWKCLLHIRRSCTCLVLFSVMSHRRRAPVVHLELLLCICLCVDAWPREEPK